MQHPRHNTDWVVRAFSTVLAHVAVYLVPRIVMVKLLKALYRCSVQLKFFTISS
jgi:hypothetical protein